MASPSAVSSIFQKLDVDRTTEAEAEAEAIQSEPIQSETSARSYTDFTLFENLPAEIRSKVWRAAAQEPNVAIIRRSRHESEHTRARWILINQLWLPIYVGDKPDLRFGWTVERCGARVPSVLHATSESRQQALISYKLAFKGINGDHGCYFNFGQDILAAPYLYLIRRAQQNDGGFSPDQEPTVQDMAQVKHLYIYQWRNCPLGSNRYDLYAFDDFENLQELTIFVSPDTYTEEERNRNLLKWSFFLDGVWTDEINPRRVTHGEAVNPTPMISIRTSKEFDDLN